MHILGFSYEVFATRILMQSTLEQPEVFACLSWTPFHLLWCCLIDLLNNMPVCVLQLSTVTNLTIYGPNPCRGRAALCSFNVEGLHATDISTLLDQEGNRLQA